MVNVLHIIADHFVISMQVSVVRWKNRTGISLKNIDTCVEISLVRSLSILLTKMPDID